MDRIALGKAGLQGWRAKVGDAVADPVSNHSRLSRDQAQAAVGAVFFLLSVLYVASTVRRMVGRR